MRLLSPHGRPAGSGFGGPLLVAPLFEELGALPRGSMSVSASTSRPNTIPSAAIGRSSRRQGTSELQLELQLS